MFTNFKSGDWLASIQNIQGVNILTHLCLVDNVDKCVIEFGVIIDMVDAIIKAFEHNNNYAVSLNTNWVETLHKLPDNLLPICSQLLEVNRIELIGNSVANELTVENFRIVPGLVFRFK